MMCRPATLAASWICAILAGCSPGGEDRPFVRRPAGTLTFARDIAPIVFRSCSPCHRPDGAGPFPLLTHQDVAARAVQIAKVTTQRYMPPWMPRAGRGEFLDARGLTADEIGVIAQWVEEGGAAGAPADLPPRPTWKDGWQLGPPDLVLELPEAFEVPADGPDIYRNFVFTVPLEQPAFVRTLDVSPDNRRVAHHALVMLDPTRKSRRLDAASPGSGFGGTDGMKLGDSIVPPDGSFNSWNPGKMPFAGFHDMAWQLRPSTDVVLQMHLQPSGKVEKVKPSIGLYFARSPPQRFPFVLTLRSLLIDVPPGVQDHAIELRYTLPVDVEVLALLPHAHYICKEISAFATLPDGSTRWLIHIDDWDFNWQGDYHLAKPLPLPARSQIHLRLTYNNSAANPRNPTSPPVRVRYGPRSLDEMGELWIQVVTRQPQDRPLLERDMQAWRAENENVSKALSVLATEPNNWAMLLDLAKVRSMQGRGAEAYELAGRAVKAAPQQPEPHQFLGSLLLQGGDREQLKAVFAHLAVAIKLRPEYFEAHNDMGLAWKQAGNPARAAQCFERARELGPDDPVAVYNLATLAYERGDKPGAIALLERALAIDPSYELARDALRTIRGSR